MNRKIIMAVIICILIGMLGTTVNAVKIVLDPGHGGVKPENTEAIGAENAERGLKEREINLKIGLYLKEYLEQYKDVNIIMTRNDDSALTIYRRAIIARKSNADLLVSLHTNDSSNTEGTGVEVWVTHEDVLAKYKQETYALAQKIANNISLLGLPKRTETGVRICEDRSDEKDIYSTGKIADYYGIIAYAMRGTKIDGIANEAGEIIGRNITWTDENDNIHETYLANEEEDIYSANLQNGEGVPTVLIEHAFIKTDADFLDSDEDLKKLAEADGKAIVEHYNLKLKEQPQEPENPEEPEKKEIQISSNKTITSDVVDVETKKLNIDENKFMDRVGTPVMAFVLGNSKDRVTGKDIALAYPELEITKQQENLVIGTGTTIKTGNKTYTAVVYGDVNCDGLIDIFDITTIVSSIISKEDLKGAQYISSDLKDNGEIDIFTITKLVSTISGATKYADLLN